MFFILLSLLAIQSQPLEYHLESTLSLSTSYAQRMSMFEDKLIMKIS